jgi:eukaryotic-like serine/threonine-protein kinase
VVHSWTGIMDGQQELVEHLFETALALKPTERSAFLDEECYGDPELRQIVDNLLADDAQAGSFLEHPPFDLLKRAITPGTRLGQYEIGARIGAGGMGEVFRARDTQLKREVAVKVILPSHSFDPDLPRRFRQEAEAAAAISHPNVVSIHNVGEQDGIVYIVTELLQGETLREKLRGGPLRIQKALEYAAQLISGVAAAHEKGIVHRDLKPENIFLTSDGQVKILDFGLAKLSPTPATDAAQDGPRTTGWDQTDSGVVMGTPAYMAPEQIRGQTIDARTDIFAFGAVLYEMLCGRPAFKRTTLADTYSAVLKEDPTDLSTLQTRLPPALNRVVQHCLEKEPQHRFQSAHDLALALQAVSGSSYPLASHRPPGTTFTLHNAFRGGKPWAITTLALLAALLVAAVLYHRSHRAQPLTEKDTIVVAEFANGTGDPVFDDTLKEGLILALNQSPFLNVLSDNRVATALQLMTRPANTALTPEVAREVCLRAGSKAYIAGSIASLGSEYVLGLKAVNCQTGDLLAQQQVTAATKENVLNALGDASSRLRSQLGESKATMTPALDLPLAAVTTSSLEALQAYSLSIKSGRERSSVKDLPYLQRAIQLDPNFAMGYWALGDAYMVLGEERRAGKYYAKAFELRAHASEREKLGIAADYYFNVTGELEKAAQVFQEQIDSYPRSGAYIGLGNVYRTQGKFADAVIAYRQYSQHNPEVVARNSLPISSLMALQRLDEARQVAYEEKARNLIDDELRTDLYILAFLDGDSAALAEEQQWFAGHLHAENVGLSLASDTVAYAGHLAKARDLTKLSIGSALRADNKEFGALWWEHDALRQAAFGNSADAKRAAAAGLQLGPPSQGVEIEAALAFAMAGDTARAESLAQDLNKRFPLDTQMQLLWLPAIHGQVAVDRKNPEHALDGFQAMMPPIEFGATMFIPTVSCLYPTYVRGEAYLAAGQSSAAASEFQKIVDHRGIVGNCWTGALAHLGIARANALESRTSRGEASDAARKRARMAYKDFLTLWKDADPDVPILQQARQEYAKLN